MTASRYDGIIKCVLKINFSFSLITKNKHYAS
jgi:hypothetical protein